MANTRNESKILEIYRNRNRYSNGDQFARALREAGETAEMANRAANGFKQSSTNSSSNAISDITKSGGNAAKGILNFGVDLAAGIAYDQLLADRTAVTISSLSGIFKGIIDAGLSATKQVNNLISVVGENAIKNISDVFKREGDILESITTKGGMAGEFATQFTNEIMRIAPEAQKLGIAFSTVQDATESLLTNSGKFSNYQGETIMKALKISAAYGETAKSILQSAEVFRNVGIGLADASERIEEIGKRSIGQGLSARATTKAVIDNLGKLNEFGFKNGTEGLANMVRQAQALKFNMDETFKVASKAFDPEGAIELSANLQVLGGAFGDLADPIKLMYDVTNNVESLQTSILGAARSLATYNVEQGRFEVTGANLRRAKAMADAMGISMSELTSAAIKGQTQLQALSEIELFDLDDDQKQFVSNLASMKNGVVGIEISKDMAKQLEDLGIKQGFVELGNLTGGQMKKIAEAQQKLASRTTEEVIKDQFTVATRSLNALNSIAYNIQNMARDRIKEDEIYNAVVKEVGGLEKAAEMSPDELNDAYQKVMEKYISTPLQKMKDEMKPYLDRVKQEGGSLLNELNLPELINKGAEEAKKNIKAGAEAMGIDLNVKVDLNSSSPQLASMVVDEIMKNPRARAGFVENILGNKKEYIT